MLTNTTRSFLRGSPQRYASGQAKGNRGVRFRAVRAIDQAGEERLARFESLRALAALGVVVGHAWGIHQAFGAGAYRTFPERIVTGGGYGVFVFFALSGYLLFRPLARAAFGGGERVDLAGYARNRALRILPLYYAVVAILFA